MARANISASLQGVDELLASFNGTVNEADAAANVALQKAAEPVLERIKDNTKIHMRTGRMQNALKIGKRKRSGGRPVVEVGVFGTDAPHALLVEYGHGGPKPAPEHPFMRPAYEATKDEAMEIAAQALREALGL